MMVSIAIDVEQDQRERKKHEDEEGVLTDTKIEGEMER